MDQGVNTVVMPPAGQLQKPTDGRCLSPWLPSNGLPRLIRSTASLVYLLSSPPNFQLSLIDHLSLARAKTEGMKVSANLPPREFTARHVRGEGGLL